ncbi:MAG TPA: sugar phosphate isomerase/epimerase family protein [Terracidiphilus sp.]|jgi:D-psicose/D-tagatose/L-ribulose 3-epimerase
MKLGVSAFAWTAKFDASHFRLLPEIKEMGFTGFEIAMFDPADLAITDIRRAFEASALECTVCAILPAGINPISPDVATRRKSLQHLIRCIEASAELGANLLGGPLYAPIGYLPEHRPTEDEWCWAVEAFQSIGEHLDKFQITLSIEPVNRSETFFLRTAREAKRLCDLVGHARIGVTIDTFHANIEEQNIGEAITSLGSQLKHLHASENDRSLLGQGHVDFGTIVAARKRINYDGYLMLEGFGYSPHEASGPGVLWADMSVSPEMIARRGAQFLSNLLTENGYSEPQTTV